MMYALICLVALAGSALTFFSGFGLGTLLVPVFALFFPVDVAIGLTAIVHFLNNIFKLALVGKMARKDIVLRFGVPSLVASFAGALLLSRLSEVPPLFSFDWGGHDFDVTPLKLTIGTLLLFFVLFDVVPRLAAIQFDSRHLAAGGLLSGFFGGLSGNQGALRSAFLIRTGMEKEAFIATGVVIACMVDIARLAVYSGSIFNTGLGEHFPLMTAAALSAFAGAFIGSRLVKKMTLKALQLVVACLLILFSMLLMAGII